MNGIRVHPGAESDEQYDGPQAADTVLHPSERAWQYTKQLVATIRRVERTIGRDSSAHRPIVDRLSAILKTAVTGMSPESIVGLCDWYEEAFREERCHDEEVRAVLGDRPQND